MRVSRKKLARRSSHPAGSLPRLPPTLKHLSLSARRPAPALLLSVALALVPACASSGDKATESKPEPIDGAALDRPKIQPEDPIGKFLADADNAIYQWCKLALTARTAAQKNQQRALEGVLVDRASRRCDELIAELSGGPPINRIRAAAMLGFSRKPEAQSPLLAALSDPHPDVVHNALLGLAVLGRADTPLDPICHAAEFAEDPQTRAQAAFALRSILNAGGSGSCAVGTARRGLADSEPFVRSQCALALGLLGDAESVPAIEGQLQDERPHVQSAAVEALLLMAERAPSSKGPVGRALVKAWAGADDEKPIKALAMDALVRIADVNYGTDLILWTEWANRLP